MKTIYQIALPIKPALIISVFVSINGFTCDSASQPSLYTNKTVQDTTPAIFIDTTFYNNKLKELANNDKSGRWPVKAPYPLPGAIIPYKRIVAYYGNFYCKQMGILGELSPGQMLKKLKQQAAEWGKADSLTPVIHAIHYIAVTAQQSPCGGLYRLHMPDSEIEKAISLADSVAGIVFLDIQVGLSTIEKELPRLKKFLQLPNVHLAIDPEFSMKSGKRPGSAIGAFDAADINYAASFLSGIVTEKKIAPKILIVHRFTENMLTNYKKIKTRPEVQLVINMDGFGAASLKKDSYYYFIYKQPVQFAGMKLFYKNDSKPGRRIMTPAEILQLTPRPIYIQYQ